MSKRTTPPRVGGFALLAQEAEADARRSVKRLEEKRFGDSPIEHLFFAALVTAAHQEHRCTTDIIVFGDHRSLEDARYGTRIFGRPESTAFIEKQVQIAGWRVDFVLHYPSLRGRDENGDPDLDCLIIECDGHDFHERTKEQAARDRARDRLAQYEGLPILRFTGSEIWNDPLGCADEVLAFMERAP